MRKGLVDILKNKTTIEVLNEIPPIVYYTLISAAVRS